MSLVRRLAANDSSIDILAMDVDWTAEFATAKWLKPVPASLAAQIKSVELAGPFRRRHGRTNCGHADQLEHRAALVPQGPGPDPAQDLDAMIDDADKLAAQGKPNYIEEQGAQYEGSRSGSTRWSTPPAGRFSPPTTRSSSAVRRGTAAEIMKELATSKGADPSLNVSMEGPGQVAFQNGTAAFDQLSVRLVGHPGGEPQGLQRHGVRLLPAGHARAPPKVSIGGYNLGISAFSSAEPGLPGGPVPDPGRIQSRDAIKGGLAPVAASIYDQPAFDKAYPFHQLIKQQLQTYGIRPQTPAYADVTLAIQKTLSPTSNINPKTVVSTLRNEIKLSLSSSALL